MKRRQLFITIVKHLLDLGIDHVLQMSCQAVTCRSVLIWLQDLLSACLNQQAFRHLTSADIVFEDLDLMNSEFLTEVDFQGHERLITS